MFRCQDMAAQQRGTLLYAGLGFTLMEGAVLVISGENGLGKTTLLKQLAALTPAINGEVHWFQTRITSCRDYGQDMVYIGDTHGLYPELTVEEQLQYFSRVYGESMRLDATIHYMKLQPHLDKRISELSAGWKRRVALCRLLLIPSLLWLLDEPMVHLDADGAQLLGGMMHSHAESGGITILTLPQTAHVPTLQNVPVHVLQLADFVPEGNEPEEIGRASV